MLPGDKFCPGCATELAVREVHGQERPVCPNCRRVIYYDPKVAVTSLVQRDGKVLLVRRGNEPGYGLWSMPGGYVDRGEVVEEAAAREVLEETGLEVAVEGLIGLFSQAGQPVMVAAFSAREVGGVLSAGEEALEAEFFPLDDLPPLAFPGDRRIIARWLDTAPDSPAAAP
jgi:8-oxo-dGTP diphosphatase